MLGGGYGVIIRPFVNFAVGMFIFLSGYLTKENENGVYRDIIYRRIKKIIIPYIIWSFIFAVVNLQILLERYAYSEISGTFILI